MKSLLDLATSGKVDLAVTARIHEDVPIEPLASRLNELPLLGISETGSVARVGHWVIGRDMLGDPGFDDYYMTACALAKQRGEEPPDWRDWDHLHSHFLQGRDYFLTWDKGILCLEQELRELFGIVVLLPEAALERLRC